MASSRRSPSYLSLPGSSVAEAARAWLAEHGYDPIYGARPLRRLVQSAIGDQLAKALLAGRIRDGDTVRVDLADSKEALAVTSA